MMDKLKQFFDAIKQEETATLATAADGIVTMRTVSPVYCRDAVLIFTDGGSKKYRQLQQCPNCCIGVSTFFAEATAAFCGATSLPVNRELRDAYCEKFPDAFDEGVAFGGRNAEFLLLHPTRLTGWAFAEDGAPPAPFDIPLA